jgi:hypothetical protein
MKRIGEPWRASYCRDCGADVRSFESHSRQCRSRHEQPSEVDRGDGGGVEPIRSGPSVDLQNHREREP